METQISDKPLVAFFCQYSYDELDLLCRAVDHNFVKEYKNGELITEDYNNSLEIWQKALKLTIKNMYDVSAKHFLPEVKNLTERHIFNKTSPVTSASITFWYLLESLENYRPTEKK